MAEKAPEIVAAQIQAAATLAAAIIVADGEGRAWRDGTSHLDSDAAVAAMLFRATLAYIQEGGT